MKSFKVDVYINGDTKGFVQKCAKELSMSESSFINLMINELKTKKERKYGKGKNAKYFSTFIYK